MRFSTTTYVYNCIGILENDTLPIRRDFCKQQHAVKAAVNEARENWIFKLASQAESSMSKRGIQWKHIKDVQSIHRGCQPVWVFTIADVNGK